MIAPHIAAGAVIHKTLTPHREQCIIIDGLEKRQKYISDIHPNTSSAYLFVNSKGKQLTKISRDLTVHFQSITNTTKKITCTNTRHITVITMSEIRLPRICFYGIGMLICLA